MAAQNLNELPIAGKSEADRYNLKAQQFLTEAKSFEIDSREMAEMASEDLKKIKAYAKDVDEKRKSLTKPLDDVKKAIMDLFRPANEYLEAAELALKNGLKTYLDAEEKKRREAEAAARKAAQEEAKKLAEAAKEAAKEGHSEAARVLEQQAAMVPASAAIRAPARKLSGISTTTVFKFEITDAALIPREYLIIDESKIRKVVQALKADTNIPGVRVYEDTQIGARSGC